MDGWLLDHGADEWLLLLQPLAPACAADTQCVGWQLTAAHQLAYQVAGLEEAGDHGLLQPELHFQDPCRA
eukprot:2520694-Alexandrium_andersonii.AAC.1